MHCDDVAVEESEPTRIQFGAASGEGRTRDGGDSPREDLKGLSPASQTDEEVEDVEKKEAALLQAGSQLTGSALQEFLRGTFMDDLDCDLPAF